MCPPGLRIVPSRCWQRCSSALSPYDSSAAELARRLEGRARRPPSASTSWPRHPLAHPLGARISLLVGIAVVRSRRWSACAWLDRRLLGRPRRRCDQPRDRRADGVSRHPAGDCARRGAGAEPTQRGYALSVIGWSATRGWCAGRLLRSARVRVRARRRAPLAASSARIVVRHVLRRRSRPWSCRHSWGWPRDHRRSLAELLGWRSNRRRQLGRCSTREGRTCSSAAPHFVSRYGDRDDRARVHFLGDGLRTGWIRNL